MTIVGVSGRFREGCIQPPALCLIHDAANLSVDQGIEGDQSQRMVFDRVVQKPITRRHV